MTDIGAATAPRNGSDLQGSIWPDEPEHFKERAARLKAYNLLSVSDLANLAAVKPLVEGLLFRDTLAQLSGPPGSYRCFYIVSSACWRGMCCGEGAVELSGDVALERPHDLLGGAALGASPCDIGPGRGVGTHADDHHRGQRTVQAGGPHRG